MPSSILFFLPIYVLIIAEMYGKSTYPICAIDYCSPPPPLPTALFIPISGRFFVSSHTGLWRLCRYALTPLILANSTLPQMLTNLIITDATEIERLKKDIATEAYIDEYRMFHIPIANVTAIDNRFKQALFANWIRGTAEFVKIKAKYKSLANASNGTASASRSKKNQLYEVDSYDLSQIQDKFGVHPITVHVNASERAMVLVPRNLQLALFNEWPQKPRVVYLLGKFAKDMDLTTNIAMTNGTQLVLRPPNPPAKGHQNADYRYEKYGRTKSHRHTQFKIAIYCWWLNW